MMDYRQAPEVKAISEDLMWEHHEDLSDDGPHIEYVMVTSGASKPPKRMFRIRKVTGIHAYLAAPQKPASFAEHQPDPFVVVEVTQFWWAMLDQDQKKGMVDHVLSHLVFDPDNDTWAIEPPEFGEFPEVLKRHGFWRPDDALKDLATAMSEQLSLLPDEERQRLLVPPEMREAVQKGEMSLEVSFAGGDSGAEADTEIVNGRVVDKATGEVLEGSRA